MREHTKVGSAPVHGDWPRRTERANALSLGLIQPRHPGATQATSATEQPWYTGQPFVAALSVAVVYPATLARTLKLLEYTCIGALLSILCASGKVLDEGHLAQYRGFKREGGCVHINYYYPLPYR